MVSCVSMGSSAVAGSRNNVVTEQTRATVGSGSVHVLVAQSEIDSDINPSQAAVATGGGLIGGLIAAHQNAQRAKKAEKLIAPIRESMKDVDADALALETTKAAFAQVDWLRSAPIGFGKDNSPAAKAALLDKGAPQTMFVEYSYDFTPDFSAMRVVAKLAVANKAAPAPQAKPEARLSAKHLAYSRSATSVVTLTSPLDKEANAARWHAHGGEPARKALALAFGELQKLLPRTLALSEADIKAMAVKTKPKENAAGFTGRLQDRNGGSRLIWTDSFVQVQMLP